jgi:titin
LLAPVITVAATLTATGPQASLSWPDVSIGETGFTVERCAGTTAQCALATANWTTLQGATSPVGHLQGGAVNYIDTTLATGATYVYRVKAVAGATAGPVGTSVQVNTPIAMVAPAAPTLSSPTGAGITVSWIDNSTNETGFLVERSVDGVTFAPLLPAVAAGAAAPTATVTSTTAQKAATGRTVSYADATAVAGSFYFYRVRSVNVTGTTVSSSEPSVSASIQLAMPAPTALTAVQSGANVALRWTDTSATETSFEVLRTDNTTAPPTQVTYTVARTATQATSVNTAVTYTDVAAVPGIAYTYAVRAVNTPAAVTATTPITYSNYTANVTGSVVIPAPTTLTTAVPATGTGVMLNWVDNATFESGYRIDRATVTPDAQGNVPAGTVYTTIATQTRTGNVVSTMGAAAFTDLTATALTAPLVYAYQVYAVKTTATTVGGVATTVSSFSAPSNEAHTSQAATVAGAPTGLTAVTSSGMSIVLSWIDNSTNENAFQVTRTDTLGASVTFATPARTGTAKTGVGSKVSYTDTTAAVGTTYTYSVAPVTSAAVAVPVVTGPSSTPVTASLTVNAPLNPTATATATGITIGWTDNSNNEIGFQIVRTGADALGVAVAAATFNVTSTAAQKTATGTARTYIDTTALPGVTYTYKVATTGGTTALPVYSASVSTTPATISVSIVPPSTPTAVITNATRITVSWTDLSNNETGFLVERLFTPTVPVAGVTPAWTALPVAVAPALPPTVTVTRTATQKTGVNAGVSYADNLTAPVGQGTYQYRVTAVNQTAAVAPALPITNATSATVSSNVLDFTVPAAPTLLTATTTAGVLGVVNLSWTDMASNETGFTVQRATNATFTAGLVSTAVPGAITATNGVVNYTLSGLTSATKYYFRVAATNTAGTSTYATFGTATAGVVTPTLVTVP